MIEQISVFSTGKWVIILEDGKTKNEFFFLSDLFPFFLDIRLSCVISHTVLHFLWHSEKCLGMLKSLFCDSGYE